MRNDKIHRKSLIKLHLNPKQYFLHTESLHILFQVLLLFNLLHRDVGQHAEKSTTTSIQTVERAVRRFHWSHKSIVSLGVKYYNFMTLKNKKPQNLFTKQKPITEELFWNVLWDGWLNKGNLEFIYKYVNTSDTFWLLLLLLFSLSLTGNRWNLQMCCFGRLWWRPCWRESRFVSWTCSLHHNK